MNDTVTSLQAILAFTAAAVLLTIAPGLDTALVLRTAAVEGPRRAILAGLGICLGCLAWGLAASAGLGALLVLSRVAFDVVRMLGAGYLFYLGFQLLVRKRAPMAAEAAVPAVSPRGWFLRGFLTNLLNPKVGVFYLTFLPQFVRPEHGLVMLQLTILGLVFVFLGLLSTVVFAVGAGRLGNFLRRNPTVLRWQGKVVGCIYFALGIRLALQER